MKFVQLPKNQCEFKLKIHRGWSLTFPHQILRKTCDHSLSIHNSLRGLNTVTPEGEQALRPLPIWYGLTSAFEIASDVHRTGQRREIGTLATYRRASRHSNARTHH